MCDGLPGLRLPEAPAIRNAPRLPATADSAETPRLQFHGPTTTTGPTTAASPAAASYPSAAAVIERNLDALVCHLRFPNAHRKRIRSTNLLERTFVEVRRRTKVIGRFPGETSALCLIWAVLELSSRGWRGVVMTPRAVAEIERLRRGQPTSDTDQPSTTEEVIAA
jgi:putative transposase